VAFSNIHSSILILKDGINNFIYFKFKQNEKFFKIPFIIQNIILKESKKGFDYFM